MTSPDMTMAAVIDRLSCEDGGLGDPTLMLPQHARTLAELTNARWNADLPEIGRGADRYACGHARKVGRAGERQRHRSRSLCVRRRLGALLSADA